MYIYTYIYVHIGMYVSILIVDYIFRSVGMFEDISLTFVVIEYVLGGDIISHHFK